MRNIDPTYDAIEQPLPEGWHTVFVGMVGKPGFPEWRDSEAAQGDFRVLRTSEGFIIGFSDANTAFAFRMRFT